MTDAAEAISFLVFIAGGHGDFPVYTDGRAAPAFYTRSAKTLAKRSRTLDFRENAQVEIGLPERPRGIYPSEATVLWAWVESTEQARRAGRFRPMPSMVLRVGASCRRLCLWALDRSPGYTAVEAANRRLSYHLHAPQKYAKPEKLRIPLPGTCIRVGRKRPAPVVVTRMELEQFDPEAVAGRLKAPPPTWVERQRASGAWR